MSSNGEAGLTGRLRADLEDLLAVDVAGLPDQTLRSDLLELFVAANQIHTAIALRVASFDARGLADIDACRTAAAWLRSYSRCSGREASGLVQRGRVLRDLPAVATAAARGEVSAEHVTQIGVLAKQVGVEAIRPADQVLADAASKVDPAELRLVCNRIRDYLDPDGPEPLELFEKRELTLSDVGGMMAIRGQLDPEGAAAVREALDALMKPPAPDDFRTVGQRRADALVDLARGAMAHGDLPTVGGMRPQVGILITPQTLLYGEDGIDARTGTYIRIGDDTDPPDISYVFDDGPSDGGEVADPLGMPEATAPVGAGAASHMSDASSGSQPDDVGSTGGEDAQRTEAAARGDPYADPRGDPHVPVGDSRDGPTRSESKAVNPHGDPLAEIGIPPPVERAWLNWYGPVPPSLAKRLACDADVWRIVLDPATGLPLDVGRAHRLVPYWIRRALYARDRGCRWPGCRVPAPWCDAHHLTPWYLGGQTRVEDLLLTCRYHHAMIHEGRWRVRLDRATGQVSVTRPNGEPHDIAPSRPWITPTAQPGEPADTS
jgi:hypothetical protein